MPPSARPFIVGLGGTTRAGSTSERAVRFALSVAAEDGAETMLIDGPALVLPIYDPAGAASEPGATRLVAALRRADGVIVASPGYHGSLSGLIKNALDYTENMARDPAPYLDGRAFGCIAVSHGWQAAVQTLTSLRGIAHALRAWPTPMGVAFTTLQPAFREDGGCADPAVATQITVMARQVVEFARLRRLSALPPLKAAAE
jgi:FMN reductase